MRSACSFNLLYRSFVVTSNFYMSTVLNSQDLNHRPRMLILFKYKNRPQPFSYGRIILKVNHQPKHGFAGVENEKIRSTIVFEMHPSKRTSRGANSFINCTRRLLRPTTRFQRGITFRGLQRSNVKPQTPRARKPTVLLNRSYLQHSHFTNNIFNRQPHFTMRRTSSALDTILRGGMPCINRTISFV